MRIKTGDKVQIIAGKDKGQSGTVLQVFPKDQRVIVEGLNLVKKHTSAVQGGQGGIEEIPAPIHVSNVMYVDPSTNEPTKLGFRFEDGKKVRFAKKSNETVN